MLKKIDQSFSQLFSNSSLQSSFDFIALIKNWKVIVGDILAAHTLPSKINEGTLIVIARHSIFAQEIMQRSQEILKSIKRQSPHLAQEIKKIHCFSSSQHFLTPIDEQSEEKSPISNKLHPYSPQFQMLKAQAENLFGAINDPELKTIFESLYIQGKNQS